MAAILDYLGRLVLPDTPATPLPAVLVSAARLATFRRDFYQWLKARTDDDVVAGRLDGADTTAVRLEVDLVADEVAAVRMPQDWHHEGRRV